MRSLNIEEIVEGIEETIKELRALPVRSKAEERLMNDLNRMLSEIECPLNRKEEIKKDGENYTNS